jgi:hypothetical protein
VIAAFAEPSSNADYAHALTKKQSEAVLEYLRNEHRVHRIGWAWWSNRTVRSLPCGNMPTPVPEKEKLPASRVEVILFTPS